MVEQNRYIMTFMRVLTHGLILRPKGRGIDPGAIELWIEALKVGFKLSPPGSAVESLALLDALFQLAKQLGGRSLGHDFVMRLGENGFTPDLMFSKVQESSRMVSQNAQRLGRYLSLEEFCTCTQTYQKYADKIDPYPRNLEETIPALQALCEQILDPVMDCFGRDRFQLTYGFCSTDLRRYLNQKDPVTGLKNGRIDPSRDQHMAHELNRNGKYYCDRLGAACDFRIVGVESNRLVEWILVQGLPFDLLYYCGGDRPIHISYAPQQRQNIWTFTTRGVPTRKGIEQWLKSFR